MGTGSLPGLKRTGRGADHSPSSRAEVEGRVELYLYSPSGPSWPVIGCTLPLPLPLSLSLPLPLPLGLTLETQLAHTSCLIHFLLG